LTLVWNFLSAKLTVALSVMKLNWSIRQPWLWW
jgi:hypothetical protein